jgi:hypothetical protein
MDAHPYESPPDRIHQRPHPATSFLAFVRKPNGTLVLEDRINIDVSNLDFER